MPLPLGQLDVALRVRPHPLKVLYFENVNLYERRELEPRMQEGILCSRTATSQESVFPGLAYSSCCACYHAARLHPMLTAERGNIIHGTGFAGCEMQDGRDHGMLTPVLESC